MKCLLGNDAKTAGYSMKFREILNSDDFLYYQRGPIP